MFIAVDSCAFSLSQRRFFYVFSGPWLRHRLVTGQTDENTWLCVRSPNWDIYQFPSSQVSRNIMEEGAERAKKPEGGVECLLDMTLSLLSWTQSSYGYSDKIYRRLSQPEFHRGWGGAHEAPPLLRRYWTLKTAGEKNQFSFGLY